MYRAILADDEGPGRARLRRLLTTHFADIELVGEATNGNEALSMMKSMSPDLAFLDIEMPGMTGIDAAKSLAQAPFIVFITAHSTYAVDAFKTMAVDYILKPVTKEQLERAIKKFIFLVSQIESRHLMEGISQRLSTPSITRLRVLVGDTVRFIPVDRIICFEAANKYTTVFTTDGTYCLEQPIIELEAFLPKKDFIRIHRKHIVNFAFVEKLDRWFDRKMKVTLTVPFDRELIVSRGYVENIEKMGFV